MPRSTTTSMFNATSSPDPACETSAPKQPRSGRLRLQRHDTDQFRLTMRVSFVTVTTPWRRYESSAIASGYRNIAPQPSRYPDDRSMPAAYANPSDPVGRFPDNAEGLLAGRSAQLIVTMGMPALIYKSYFRAHGVRGLDRSTLGFAGMAPVHETLLGNRAAMRAISRSRRACATRRLISSSARQKASNDIDGARRDQQEMV